MMIYIAEHGGFISRKRFCNKYRVSYQTYKNALKYLKEEGFIYSKQGYHVKTFLTYETFSSFIESLF